MTVSTFLHFTFFQLIDCTRGRVIFFCVFFMYTSPIFNAPVEGDAGFISRKLSKMVNGKWLPIL